MAIKITNNPRSVLAVSISAAQDLLRVRNGHGNRFPLLADGDWFPLTIEDDLGKSEVARAVSRQGDEIKVVRGSSPFSFGAGSSVQLRLTQQAMNEIEAGL